jgi:hypothetical protein
MTGLPRAKAEQVLVQARLEKIEGFAKGNA